MVRRLSVRSFRSHASIDSHLESDWDWTAWKRKRGKSHYCSEHEKKDSQLKTMSKRAMERCRSLLLLIQLQFWIFNQPKGTFSNPKPTELITLSRRQISGSLFLAMGLWLHLSNQGYATLYPNHIGLSAESFFILFGGLSILISFFGCCGSFFESRCCLIIVSHVSEVTKPIQLKVSHILCSIFHS